MYRELARKPVATIVYDCSTGNITTSAWKEIEDATTEPASAVEIFNGSGQILRLAKGSAGSEVTIPYTVPPGGNSGFMPIEFAKNIRIAMKAVDANATNGYVLINLFA